MGYFYCEKCRKRLEGTDQERHYIEDGSGPIVLTDLNGLTVGRRLKREAELIVHCRKCGTRAEEYLTNDEAHQENLKILLICIVLGFPILMIILGILFHKP